MRCLVCRRLSWRYVCTDCQAEYLRPSVHKRTLLPGFDVVSFYAFDEIEEFLKAKYAIFGNFIYKTIAKNSLTLFAQNFASEAFVVPVDARLNAMGFSHTAVLARAMRTKFLKPRYDTLYASNDVNYAGKSLAFRLANPRGFRYSGPVGDVILVDDVVTTGTTLKEAYTAVRRAGANPLFALVLADADR